MNKRTERFIGSTWKPQCVRLINGGIGYALQRIGEFAESACKPHVCVALIDGEKLHYTLCADCKDAYPDIKDKEYLGKGVIYSINGVLQNSKEECHFWIHSEIPLFPF